MSKLPQDWEQQLKEKPFTGKHFTGQLQQNVNERLDNPPARKLHGWTYAAALLPLLMLIVVIGYSSASLAVYRPCRITAQLLTGKIPGTPDQLTHRRPHCPSHRQTPPAERYGYRLLLCLPVPVWITASRQWKIRFLPCRK